MSKNHRLQEYKLCHEPAGDRFLKRILLFAISVVYSRVPHKAIRDFQITGSIANGEGTVIITESGIVSSDFDILVDLKLQYYLLAVVTGLGEKLSDMVTLHLLSRGIRTHVTFTMYSKIVQKMVGIFQTSSIYDYEFSCNKSLMKTSINRVVRLPSRQDALQLLFTIVAEHLTLYQRFNSQMDRLYWLTKRYLTLLYSMLIFQGKPRLTYAGRVKTAIEALPPSILTRHEQKLALALLKFKLTGNPNSICKFLHSGATKKTVILLEKKLLSKVQGILTYQLAAIYSAYRNRSKQSLEDLLNIYFARTKKSFVEILVYTYLLSLILLVTRRSDKRKAIKTVTMARHSLMSVANYLVSLKWLYRKVGGIFDKDLSGSRRLESDKTVPDALESLWSSANETKYIR